MVGGATGPHTHLEPVQLMCCMQAAHPVSYHRQPSAFGCHSKEDVQGAGRRLPAPQRATAGHKNLVTLRDPPARWCPLTQAALRLCTLWHYVPCSSQPCWQSDSLAVCAVASRAHTLCGLVGVSSLPSPKACLGTASQTFRLVPRTMPGRLYFELPACSCRSAGGHPLGAQGQQEKQHLTSATAAGSNMLPTVHQWQCPGDE